jgi:RNA polymerase sigma-70 factor (ECF subfamily)
MSSRAQLCRTTRSSAASTDWREITLLYDRLLQIQPSPVVELNRAVAIAMCEGPEQGLRLIDELLERDLLTRKDSAGASGHVVHGHLAHYHLAHAARADLRRRLGGFRRPALRMRRCSP